MSHEYADEDLAQLVQGAFDKYLLPRMEEMLEKHWPALEKLIQDRIEGKSNWTPELSQAFSKRVTEGVDTVVGNYLRVGHGRDMIDVTAMKYVDRKLEEHIEQQVQFRLNRLMDKLKKQFSETTGG